ncbi:MAG TPA: adenylate/guanylate cyclase domain-containing protein [Gaiellales bacterium]|nr:adenylate/guanylate cyclase domain-containing protein [Gaiellales bacterium]
MADVSTDRSSKLRPFLPRLTIRWISEEPDVRVRALEGTVVFVDISGFTKMSERLARLGRVGAEEVTDVVGFVFRQLLGTAYANGGGLIKFGGDALLLFFSGEHHASDGVAAAIGMRRTLSEMGAIDTSAGKVRLRMSVGVHSGEFHFFLVGERHRELLLTGPGASTVVAMEGTADAGEVVVSLDTAAQLPPELLSQPKGEGMRLRRHLRPDEARNYEPDPQHVPPSVDLAECIPVSLRELLLTGHGDPEHRRVTIGFIHYDGLDEMVAARPAEEVADALEALVSAAQVACEAHGVTFLGTDVDRDGGKLILVTGAPTASPDDEARMLAALRELQAAELSIPIRVGVNTGPVFAGDIGPSYRRTYTVMGDAVNLAARVMGKAEPGQILASQSVLDACSVTFETTELDPFMVKGKTLPVYASVIGRPLGTKATTGERELPMVGRDFETGILQRAVRAALQGEGSIVEIVGPPGIGKTRMLTAMREVGSEMRLLSASCDLYGASTPYAALRPLLLQALEVDPDASREAIVSRLMHVVWSGAPELSMWLPLLGVPLDLDMPTNPDVDQLGQEFRRTRLNEVVTKLLSSILSGPTLIAIEDAHWMDEASADLLLQLCREVAGRPWLIGVTRRNEASGFAAPAGGATVSLHLDTLAEEKVVELLIAATEDSPLRPHEMSILARRSGGNPLFLQELLSATRLAGTTEGLPDTVEAMVTAQIDQLASPDRRLLRVASVLGMRFRSALAEQLLDEPATAGAAAWRRLGDFLAEDGAGFYRFRHALMRDAAYEGLAYRRRRDLHFRAGETIERQRATDEAHIDLLAMHFFHGHVQDKAWDYSRRAAAVAESKFAIADAAEHLERALQVAPRGAHGDPAAEAESAEALGDLRERMGQYPQAAAAYRRARRLLEQDEVALGRLYFKHSVLEERSGSNPQALRWLRRGMQLLEGRTDTPAAQQYARLIASYGQIRQAQGRRLDGVAWLSRAIEIAQQADEKEALAHAYFILDWALVELGRGSEAVHSERALELYRELGKLGPQATIYNNLGLFAWWEGRWDEAVELYDKGRQLRVRIGDEVDAATGTHNIAEVMSDQGRLAEAQPLFVEALRVWRSSEYGTGVAYATRSLGQVASRQGDFERAAALYDAAREQFQALVAESELIDTDTRIAEALAFQGRSEEAIELASACLKRTTAGGGATQDPLLHRVRGYAHAQRAEWEPADGDFDRSLEIAKARNARHEVAHALDAIARVAEARGGSDPDARAQADELYEALGIVFVPAVPLEIVQVSA